MSSATIYERVGGGPAFLALAAAHHGRCLRDPVLYHPFSCPVHPDHLRRLAAYWAEVFGGPAEYSAGMGGHSGMLGLHAGQGADADLGERFVRCFVLAADDAGLPDDNDLRAALRAYMEWAVAEVLSCSPKDFVVAAGQEVPHWSWGGLQRTP